MKLQVDRSTFLTSKFYFLLSFGGTTGFDSKVRRTVSMSSNEKALVNPIFKKLNGESNYALAA
jgi:hypothetical protein